MSKTELKMPAPKPRKAQPKGAKRAAPKATTTKQKPATITEQLRRAMPKGRERTISSLAAFRGQRVPGTVRIPGTVYSIRER